MCGLAALSTDRQIRVADIKKPIIENIVMIANICKEIDYIILFGSSLENKCTEQSDIDLAIISNVTRTKLLHSNSYDRYTICDVQSFRPSTWLPRGETRTQSRLWKF